MLGIATKEDIASNINVEGWNHRYNALVCKSHLRIKSLIEKLKHEAESSVIKCAKFDLNLNVQTVITATVLNRFLRNCTHFRNPITQK